MKNQTFFPRLLDAHDHEFAAGVPEEVFRALFHICSECGQYMTKRLSSYHHDDDEDFDSKPPCIYICTTHSTGWLNQFRRAGVRRVFQDFPVMSLLISSKVEAQSESP